MSLQSLFMHYNVPSEFSLLAKIQTLISKHNLNYNEVVDLYDYERLKGKYNVI
jgi:hypothetical protein